MKLMRRIRADLVGDISLSRVIRVLFQFLMLENRLRVCAVIAERTIDAGRSSIEQAAKLADMIEVRLDYLDDFEFTGTDCLRAILENKPIPAIITCRAATEGGQKIIDDRLRLRLLIEGARRYADYCDVEAAHYEEAARLSPDLSRLIVSYHNLHETPDNIDDIYNRVTAMPAAVHKIVTRATTIADTLAIFKLLERARAEGKRLIAMAMGQAGVITRVLGPSRGSFLTYGSLASGKESAEGQLTCEELIDLYRIRQLSPRTSITGIIGSPVTHSASPAMHNRGFAELGLDYVYLPFDVEDLGGFINRFVRPATRELDWTPRGFSVTIPHKRRITHLLDEVHQSPGGVGAVNTVVIDQDRLVGYNTDVRGAMQPLERLCTLKGVRCGVIGAGGAARAVILGLSERGAIVDVFARDPVSANSLNEEFGVSVSPLDSFASSDVRIVINTTPIGMRGHSEGSSPVPAEALHRRLIVYDLVYNPLETRLLEDARAAGCQTLTGIEMLIAQAGLQFELWTGKKPPLDEMRKAALFRIRS